MAWRFTRAGFPKWRRARARPSSPRSRFISTRSPSTTPTPTTLPIAGIKLIPASSDFDYITLTIPIGETFIDTSYSVALGIEHNGNGQYLTPIIKNKTTSSFDVYIKGQGASVSPDSINWILIRGTVPPTGSVPAVPTNLITIPIYTTEIDLTWDAMTSASSYNVYRDAVLVYSPSSNSQNDTGLTNGTTYGYTVSSVNVNGESAQCSNVNGLTYPAAPVGLTVNVISDTEIDLSWTAVTSATSYNVYRDSVLVHSPSGNSQNDTGLTAATLYHYYVTAVNASGEGAPSSTVDGTTSTTPSISYAMEFDGVSNYITIPRSADFYPSGDFTIEFWLKTSGGCFIGLNFGGGGGASGYMMLEGLYGFPIYVGVNYIAVAGTTPVDDGTWHHCAFQREVSALTLWVDGTVCGTGTLGGKINDPSNDFQIGGYNGNLGAGAFTQFRFSSLARYPGTTTFVPATSFTPDTSTVMYLKFDEGTGTTVADSSGNGHNATATGTPAWVTGV